MHPWLIINNQIVSSGSPVLFCDNRSFRYGDGLFETLRVKSGRSFYPKDHLERLHAGADFLKLKIDDRLSLENLEKNVIQLLNKNRSEGDARIRLSVFRKAGGFYTAETPEVDYMLETFPLKTCGFELNSRGLQLGVCPVVQRQRHRLSNFKTSNSLVSVLASVWADENAFDECILLNDSGRVSGAAASNLFCVLMGEILTPPIEEGCVAGTMRKKILTIAKNEGFVVIEKSLNLSDLDLADEIFLTNAINGIRWTARFNERNLNNTVSHILFKKLTNLKA